MLLMLLHYRSVRFLPAVYWCPSQSGWSLSSWKHGKILSRRYNAQLTLQLGWAATVSCILIVNYWLFAATALESMSDLKRCHALLTYNMTFIEPLPTL